MLDELKGHLLQFDEPPTTDKASASTIRTPADGVNSIKAARILNPLFNRPRGRPMQNHLVSATEASRRVRGNSVRGNAGRGRGSSDRGRRESYPTFSGTQHIELDLNAPLMGSQGSVS